MKIINEIFLASELAQSATVNELVGVNSKYKTEDDIPEQKQEEVSINYKEMNEKLILALGKLTETLSKNSTNLLQLQTYQNNYNEQSKVYKEEDEILFIPDIDISQTKIKKSKEIVTKQLSDEIDLD